MSTDLSLITLIAEASILVQLVMLVLAAASVVSWFIIFQKNKLIKTVSAEAVRFEDEFWSGGDLSELYTQLSRRRLEREGMDKVFETGFAEFARSYKTRTDLAFLMASIQRIVKEVLSREEYKL